MKQLIDEWDSRNKDIYSKPQFLYDRFKLYFHFLNVGRPPTEHKAEIFEYNGGLFKPDEILDAIRMDDNILKTYIIKIATYDFDTDVDVNILGHIFEHSLTEIEEITNELITGEKQISKRKKDGVFYTPRYITHYIVENTIGKLCVDKRKELNIDETEYFTDQSRLETVTLQLKQKLIDYRNWLLSLTICDPACGSGAFLNAALDFLVTEHCLIDEMYAKILGNQCQNIDNIANVILEYNLFGVDINEESVEIAKLALWLRTAMPHRKLNSLNENIKCGNSLISDPEVADEKAFDWHKEFPQVFEKGGFDVVIGNPPYVPTEYISLQDKEYLEKNYKSAFGRINLYPIFFFFLITLLRNNW
jgi:type I restriction-modification system DNA methylase subunit